MGISTTDIPQLGEFFPGFLVASRHNPWDFLCIFTCLNGVCKCMVDKGKHIPLPMEHLDILWVDVVPFCGHLSGRRLRPRIPGTKQVMSSWWLLGGATPKLCWRFRKKTTINPTTNAAKMVICVQVVTVVTCCFSEIAKLTLFCDV